jgi:aminoacrylate hydrolase
LELIPGGGPFAHFRGGAGPPVLLVPGLGGTRSFFAAQLDALLPHYTVFTWDQRGSGTRSHEAFCHEPAELAADVALLIETETSGTAVLVGHSMGAAVCQHAALAYPDRVSGLVLSAAWAGPDPAFTALLHARREILRHAGAEAYLLASTGIASQPGSAESHLAGLAERARELDVSTELARLDALASFDLRTEIAGISQPVEILAVADDQLTPVTMAEDLLARLPDAQLTTLAVGGHLAPRSQPAAFNAALLRALARLHAPQPSSRAFSRPAG